MHKRLKIHGAETLDSAYMVHSYAQSSSRPVLKPLPKETHYYAPGHTPIK